MTILSVYIFLGGFSVADDKNEQALQDFLLDIECLEPLSKWTGRFNLFDILKITRAEIRHSNILSWLLDPNENHGLGASVLEGFVQYVIKSFSDNEDVFQTLLMDYYDFVVLREWKNIDLMAISDEGKFVLCIENKIDTGEHDDQLNRYREIVEKKYPDYRKMYIYLSPEGLEASDSNNWHNMSYEDVLGIIEKARKNVKLLPEVALLIDNYIETIRRNIVSDKELEIICAKIYAKHKKALDLIYENIPDKASELADIFLSWARDKTQEGEIEVVEEKCIKSYTRFKTSTMSEIMPDSVEADSGWDTKNHYFYEIRNIEGKKYFMQFMLSSKNMTDEQKNICDKISAKYEPKVKKDNWQWRTCYSTDFVTVDEELSEKEIKNNLDSMFAEIKEFEKNVKKLFATK